MPPRLGALWIALAAFAAALGAMWVGLGLAVGGVYGPDAALNPAGYLLPLIGLVTFHGGLLLGRLRPSPVLVWLVGPVMLYGSIAALVVAGDGDVAVPSIAALLAFWAALAVAAGLHAVARAARPLR